MWSSKLSLNVPNLCLGMGLFLCSFCLFTYCLEILFQSITYSLKIKAIANEGTSAVSYGPAEVYNFTSPALFSLKENNWVAL